MIPSPPPTKVLHIINGEYYAGAERVQDLLAANLPALGYEVSFVCLKPVSFPAARRYQAAPLYRLPMGSAFDLRPIPALIRLIRQGGYRLLHTHYTRGNLLGGIASAITAVPMVQHIHGVIGFDSPTRIKRVLNRLVERLGMLQAREVIVVSEHLRATIAAPAALAKKLRVIHNGVPPHPGLAPRTLRQACPVIGTVAHWRPGKGLEDLLRALHDLARSGMDFALHLVGGFLSPGYEEGIRQQAADLGLLDRIDWLGPTTAVTDCLRDMDLFVLPSLSEGLPMVILEAMAAGVPVVATDVGGVGEAIRHQVDGLLIPPQGPEAMADAIRTLLNEPGRWASYRASAHCRQADLFSDRHMATAVAEVYTRLLAPTGSEGQAG